MTTCRWDEEARDYLTDGKPCRTDDYGDPTRHCTARRTCSVHIGRDEMTCPRCIARTRANLRRITPLYALTLPVAIATGVNSPAAVVAAPAADPERWSARRIAMRSHLATWERVGRITEEQHIHARATMEDDDERHPYSVLGRWCLMIAEDYGHDLPTLTVASAADYLDRQLARIANDPEQDWPLFAAEVRKCYRHLEAVVALASHVERGAPCPDCTSEETGVGPRLIRQYPHWCEDEACERIHYEDDSADMWACPREPKHRWTHEAYTNWIEERKMGA